MSHAARRLENTGPACAQEETTPAVPDCIEWQNGATQPRRRRAVSGKKRRCLHQPSLPWS